MFKDQLYAMVCAHSQTLYIIQIPVSLLIVFSNLHLVGFFQSVEVSLLQNHSILELENELVC